MHSHLNFQSIHNGLPHTIHLCMHAYIHEPVHMRSAYVTDVCLTHVCVYTGRGAVGVWRCACAAAPVWLATKGGRAPKQTSRTPWAACRSSLHRYLTSLSHTYSLAGCLVHFRQTSGNRRGKGPQWGQSDPPGRTSELFA